MASPRLILRTLVTSEGANYLMESRAILSEKNCTRCMSPVMVSGP